MNRVSFISDILKKKGFNKYLEIGTYTGISLLPTRAWFKTGVDPKFQISTKRKLKWLLKNPSNITNRYFEETSDSFFANRKGYLKKNAPFHLMFVDGLHTFEASLKDVLNSLGYLSKNGIVLMHDCHPPNEIAAIPAMSFQEVKDMKLEGFTKEWCGDVWKTIHYLRSKYEDQLLVDVIDTDYGLGVIRFKDSTDLNLELDTALFNEINALTYSDLVENIDWISLKDIPWAESELIQK